MTGQVEFSSRAALCRRLAKQEGEIFVNLGVAHPNTKTAVATMPVMRAKRSDCMDTVRFWLSVASLFGLFGVAVLLLTLAGAFGQGIAALPFNLG
jgi:hypothetical protein